LEGIIPDDSSLKGIFYSGSFSNKIVPYPLKYPRNNLFLRRIGIIADRELFI
jgi:hypothetical protein